MTIDSESRITNDLKIVWWGSEHLLYSLAIAFPSIVIWGFGIPLFAWIILARHKDEIDIVEFREKYGFLLNGYKKEYYYLGVYQYVQENLNYFYFYLPQNCWSYNSSISRIFSSNFIFDTKFKVDAVFISVSKRHGTNFNNNMHADRLLWNFLSFRYASSVQLKRSKCKAGRQWT